MIAGFQMLFVLDGRRKFIEGEYGLCLRDEIETCLRSMGDKPVVLGTVFVRVRFYLVQLIHFVYTYIVLHVPTLC